MIRHNGEGRTIHSRRLLEYLRCGLYVGLVTITGESIGIMFKGGKGGGRGQGNAGGWPSTTGKPSGGNRSNNPPGGGEGRGQGNAGGWPSTTGNPSGGNRSNNPPGGGGGSSK